jgi:hypothetical protein
MLDLKILELILSELTLLERFFWSFVHFPKAYSLDAKPPGVGFLNSNPAQAGLGKTLRSRAGRRCPEVQGLRGLAVLIVKFGKGFES